MRFNPTQTPTSTPPPRERRTRGRSQFRNSRRFERPRWEKKPQPEEFTVRENHELNGVEILFPAQPDTSIINEVKNAGFKYSYQGEHLWYARKTDASLAFAHAMKARLEQASETAFIAADI